MAKTEVYSWRLERSTKLTLEREARRRSSSLAGLLDDIVREWIDRHGAPSADEEEVQRQLQDAARRHFGTLSSGDPMLATDSRERLRRILIEKRTRSHAEG